MHYILSHKYQFITFLASVVLSVLLVALYVSGATLIDTNSVGIGTTTVGAGLYVQDDFTSVLSGDAYIYGRLNLPFLVATSTTLSSFGGSVGVGTTTPGTTPIGLYVMDYANIAGVLALEDNLETSFVLATSTTIASAFSGSVGVGTATPGTSPIGLYVSEYANIGGVLELEDNLQTSYVIATSTTIASAFSGSVGVGTATPGTAPIGLYVSEYADIGGPLVVEDNLETSFILSTSTTATSTLSSFGSSLASTTITIDGYSGRMVIGSTSVPMAGVGTSMSVDPALTIAGQGSAASATGTLYITGGGASGGQILLRTGQGGSRCVSITAFDGGLDIGASGSEVEALLVTKVVSCPK